MKARNCLLRCLIRWVVPYRFLFNGLDHRVETVAESGLRRAISIGRVRVKTAVLRSLITQPARRPNVNNIPT